MLERWSESEDVRQRLDELRADLRPGTFFPDFGKLIGDLINPDAMLSEDQAMHVSRALLDMLGDFEDRLEQNPDAEVRSLDLLPIATFINSCRN